MQPTTYALRLATGEVSVVALGVITGALRLEYILTKRFA
jgi:hypothetical protein